MPITDQHLLDILDSFLGVHENNGDNRVRFWHDIGRDDMLSARIPASRRSWCAAFASAVYRLAGAPLPSVDTPNGFLGCEAGLNYARKHGELVPFAQGRPGDIYLCDSGLLEGKKATGHAGHTGIARAFAAGAVLGTEGNTSAGAGSQAHGGIVAHKTRPATVVLGLWRPKGLVVPFKPTPAKPVAKAPVVAAAGVPFPGQPVAQGSPKPGAVRLVQRAVHAEPDGQFGPDTKKAVAAWQRAHKLPASGVVDRRTWGLMFPAAKAA